jgi:hypothetical protein
MTTKKHDHEGPRPAGWPKHDREGEEELFRRRKTPPPAGPLRPGLLHFLVAMALPTASRVIARPVMPVQQRPSWDSRGGARYLRGAREHHLLTATQWCYVVHVLGGLSGFGRRRNTRAAQ